LTGRKKPVSTVSAAFSGIPRLLMKLARRPIAFQIGIDPDTDPDFYLGI